MSRTLAFFLSALAGVIVWIGQVDVFVPAARDDTVLFGISTNALISFALMLSGTMVAAILIHVLETRFERDPYRKYRLIREDIHLILSHWRDDLLRPNQRKTQKFHKKMIEELLRSIGRTLDKGLPGADFQLSIMVPSKTEESTLEIGYACRSDGGQMISFTQGRKFQKGEGYCGSAWYEMAPQSGNGRSRWLVLKDPRYYVARPPGHRDEDKSYFAVPIPSPAHHDSEILGVLSIDSTNAQHFLRGSKNAVFLKRLFTPILGILIYHLESAKED